VRHRRDNDDDLLVVDQVKEFSASGPLMNSQQAAAIFAGIARRARSAAGL